MLAHLCFMLILQGTPAGQTAPTHPVDSVTPFPALTGQWKVGTGVAYLTDSARRGADFPSGRPITLQLWYPTAQTTGPTAPYLFEPGLARELWRNQYYQVDSLAIVAWSIRKTRARLDAFPAPGLHPLVTFSVGLGVIRANYTSLAEELASHGLIVAMVETPLAGLMLLPGGAVVQDTLGISQTAGGHRVLMRAWAEDISYALDWLQHGVAPGGLARAAQSIDWAHVTAAGHSSGGLLAVEIASRDRRVGAAVNLDGGLASPEQEPLSDVVTTGTIKPTLFLNESPIYSDADLARRGLTRAQWESRGKTAGPALDRFATRSTAPLRVARVAGTGHFSFSDAPFVMPSTLTRFGGKIIAGPRGLLIITTAIETLSQYTVRLDSGLDILTRRFPELSLDPVRTSPAAQ